jgi:hypothetical protein
MTLSEFTDIYSIESDDAGQRIRKDNGETTRGLFQNILIESVYPELGMPNAKNRLRIIFPLAENLELKGSDVQYIAPCSVSVPESTATHSL